MDHNKTKKNNKQVKIIAVVLTLVIFFSAALFGFLYAKYKKEFDFSGNVNVTVNLAESFRLYEHEVTQGADGSYIVNNNKIVDKNSYIVLPGVDIPKDPVIDITGKSNVPAYLYIEVVDEIDQDIIKYHIDTSKWLPLENARSKYDGTFYVYSIDGITPAILDNNTDVSLLTNIGIIKNNILTVTSTAKFDTSVNLDFYAYLIQKYEGGSAADVFNNLETP